MYTYPGTQYFLTDHRPVYEHRQFASRTRQLCIRLLALVKWAGSVSKVDKSAVIMTFLDKQSMLFVDTADKLSQMARQELVSGLRRRLMKRYYVDGCSFFFVIGHNSQPLFLASMESYTPAVIVALFTT